jgi:hypothetical protein
MIKSLIGAVGGGGSACADALFENRVRNNTVIAAVIVFFLESEIMQLSFKNDTKILFITNYHSNF